MSANSPHTPEDRALARRYNFLGLPSEKFNGSLSFAELRAELGDDNAGSLVTQLGVLAKAHNLEQLGIPLHHAVDRILQSLTADERRSIAQGGAIPPRVEAMMKAEGEAAKKLSNPNSTAAKDFEVHGAAIGLSPGGLNGFGAKRFASIDPMREGGGSAGEGTASRSDYQSLSSSAPVGLRNVTANAFARSELAVTNGMSWNTFQYVRGAAARDNAMLNTRDLSDSVRQIKSLGFTSNDKEAVYHGALIEHYDPKKEETHEVLKRFGQGLKQDKEFQAGAKKLGNPNLSSEEIDSTTDQIVERVKTHRNESGVENAISDPARPELAKKGINGLSNDQVLDAVKKAGGNNPKAMRQLMEKLDRVQTSPNDPRARNELKNALPPSADHEKQAAMESLTREAQLHTKQEQTVEKESSAKVARQTRLAAREDNSLDSLNNDIADKSPKEESAKEVTKADSKNEDEKSTAGAKKDGTTAGKSEEKDHKKEPEKPKMQTARNTKSNSPKVG